MSQSVFGKKTNETKKTPTCHETEVKIRNLFLSTSEGIKMRIESEDISSVLTRCGPVKMKRFFCPIIALSRSVHQCSNIKENIETTKFYVV